MSRTSTAMILRREWQSKDHQIEDRIGRDKVAVVVDGAAAEAAVDAGTTDAVVDTADMAAGTGAGGRPRLCHCC